MFLGNKFLGNKRDSPRAPAGTAKMGTVSLFLRNKRDSPRQPAEPGIAPFFPWKKRVRSRSVLA